MAKKKKKKNGKIKKNGNVGGKADVHLRLRDCINLLPKKGELKLIRITHL
jgi:hypothetical protein